MKTYHITGLAIRGYFETGKWWKPKKNETLKCIFKEGKVTVIKGKVNCGSVPKEIKEESRMFIKAGGNIEAKVIDKNPRHRGKGEEIPCIYIWSGLNTQLIKDAVKEAKKAVAKARKEAKDVKIQFEEQKIPPKEKPGTSSQNMTDNDTSGPSKSSKKQKEKPGTSCENQNMIDSSGPPKSSKKQNEKPGTSSQMMTDSDTSGSAKSSKKNEKPGTSSQKMTDSDTSGSAKSGKQNEKEGSRKRQSNEFGKDSPNGKVARIEDVTKPKKTSVKKSKSDTMLKNKKDKELPQATVSDSKPGTSSQMMTDSDTSGSVKSGKQNEKVEGTRKRQSVEFGKDSPNGKVARMEEVTKPKKTSVKKSKSDTMLKNKKDKELPQATVSDSKVEGSHKKQSVEFGKDSPNGKVAQMEEVTKPKKTLKKSKSDTMLKNKKDKELSQATVSDSKRVVQDMTDQLQKGEGTTPVKPLCQSADKKTSLTKSASSSKTPNSGNKITKYFTPKSSQSVESVVDNDKEINSVRKKILQKEDEKGVNNEENEKDLTAGSRNLSEEKPLGSLFDVNGHVETVLLSEAKVAAARSVCKIFSPSKDGTLTATGFRVGSRFIMTACHVTSRFLEGHQYAAEKYVVFNYKHESGFLEEDKFYLGKTVFSNLETDISVVELECDSRTLPPPLHLFCSPVCDRGFHLIGHSQGNPMETNLVDKIYIDNLEKAKLRNEMYEKSFNYTGGRHCDCPPHDTIDNPYRFLFRCRFTKGGSGAPGVVLIGNNIYVTTVLLWGYPNWYFDKTFEEKKVTWPEGDCIQQGVNLKSLQEIMHLAYPELSVDIFGDQPIS